MSKLSSQGDASSVTSIIKGAVIGRIVGVLMLISVIALLAWGVYKLFQKYFPQLTPNSKNVGDSCVESFECVGYGLLKGEGQVECCGAPNNKYCTKSVQGALGVWVCPEDIHGGTKNIGDSCKESSECAGYALLKGVGQIECCGSDPNNKHCTKSVQGALNVMACPEDVIKKPNTVSVGQSCKESSECAGYKDGSGPACCGPEGHKTCTQKRKDWFGAWYCPEECVGSFGAKFGTCKAN